MYYYTVKVMLQNNNNNNNNIRVMINIIAIITVIRCFQVYHNILWNKKGRLHSDVLSD